MSKGATRTDKAAHMVMDFIPNPAYSGVTSKYGYIAFYHEEGLCSVRNMGNGIVGLVYASNPTEAIDRIRRNGDAYCPRCGQALDWSDKDGRST